MTPHIETFRAPWPGVLVEMKDFLDLWFLARGRREHPATLRIFISKTLVAQAQLQPHVREFRNSIARIPNDEHRRDPENGRRVEHAGDRHFRGFR